MRFKILIILLVTVCQGYSQKKVASRSAVEKATDSISSLMRLSKIPGLSISVSVKGKLVFSKGFGYADLEQKVLVNPGSTKFRIGSISKALTAAALGRLYEQNRIFLDSSIYFYLPDFPKKRYRPTIRQIGGHIGGIRHYRGDEFLIAKHYPTVTDGLQIFRNDSLLYKPSTKYQYSSHGFNLLSAAMEKAAGKDFLSLMNDEVFKPLKLFNTLPDLTDSLISYRSRYYSLQDDKWINAPFVDNSYKWAGGGFLSTSEDLILFANALLRNDFLKKETVSLFTSTQKLSNGEETNYGLGFSTRKDNSGFSYFGHSGGSVGGTCNMVIYPEKEVVVVILTNMTGADLRGSANNIAQLFMQ